MKKGNTRQLSIIVIFASLLLYAFSSSHPVSGGTGYTGAPGDNVCATCHSGNNAALQGDVLIEGLPTMLNAGDVIPITVRVTNPSLNAARAGYQLVALDNNDMAIGSIDNEGNNSFVKVANGREYVGHQPARSFLSNNDVSFTFDYTVPTNLNGATDITFYAAAIIANGANGNGNDRFVTTSENRVVVGGTMPLNISIVSSSDSPCFDPAEGIATAEATGGATPYNYLWSDGTPGATNDVLPLGVSSVTVTDDDGNTASTSVSISSPPLLELDILAVAPAPCDGQTGGSASVAATGGNGGYQYAWPGGLSGPSQPSLDVGTYEVTATDNNNCEAFVEVVIDALPVLTGNPTVEQVTCAGAGDGAIILNLTGGTPPLDILWENNTSTEDRFDLTPGNYSVTVLDDNDCMYTAMFEITEPDSILITDTITNVSCFGLANGAIDVSVAGGIPPYQYRWSNNVTSQDLNMISGGTYDLTVTDASNCEVQTSFTVDEPTDLEITLIDSMDVVCFADTTGSLTIAVTGGTEPYTTVWSDGGDGMSLAAGMYTVSVTDANNCLATATYQIDAEYGEITVAITTVLESGPGTMDGSANAIVVGGVPNYDFSWSTGDTTSQITNLSSGNYTLTLTDAVGCQVIQTVTIGAGNCLLGVTPTIADNVCPGEDNGEISLDLVNAMNPSILWSTGDTTLSISDLADGLYSVTITDGPDCNIVFDSLVVTSPDPLIVDIVTIQTLECDGDNAILTYTVSNLANLDSIIWSGGATVDTLTVDSTGIIILTAVDMNGCVTADTLELFGADTIAPVLILTDMPTLFLDADGNLVDDPDALVDDIVESCSVDSITLNYTLGSDSLTACDLIGNTINVSITVVDVQGNSADTVVTAVIADTLAPVLVSADTILITNCDTVPAPSIVFTDNCGPDNLVTTATLVDSLLNPGTYEMEVTVTDGNGNSMQIAVSVIVQPAYTPVIDIVDVSCAGLSDGSFEVLSLLGYDGVFTVFASAAVDLEAGTYAYTVVDSVGCSLVDTVIIGEPTAITIDTFVINDASDSTSTNGSIGLQVSGGTAPYSYTWMDETGTTISTNSFIAAVGTGMYFLDITDSNGCMIQDTFTIGDGTIIVSTEGVDLSSIRVYPNPARDFLILEGFPTATQFRLFDTNGRIIYSRKETPTTMDVSDLHQGVYIAEFSNGQVRHRERIVILK